MSVDTYERYNREIAENLSWHKQVVFTVVKSESFAYMDDETLYNFIKYQTEVLDKGADVRKARLSELELWEKENGQDALYWAMKVVCDNDTMFVAHLIGNRSKGIAVFKKRIECNAKLHFMKSQEIFPDTDDDKF